MRIGRIIQQSIRSPWLYLASVVLSCAGRASANINIVLTSASTIQNNPAAVTAFNAAVAEWDAKIGNNITVNITANFGTPSSAKLAASTSNVVVSGRYHTIRDTLVSVAAGIPDDAMVASLPTVDQFSLQSPFGTTLSGSLQITQANAKVFGFSVSSPSNDATVTFNNADSFDYDRSNGVDSNKIDFETVAAREIGHVLGFDSDLDTIDSGLTSVTPTTLDLYRFSVASAPTTAAQFTTATRSLVSGDDEVLSDTISKLEMSTGILHGDGNPGNDWKDLVGTHLGVMAATLPDGVYYDLGPNDLRAMELIGYTVVPEPTWVMLIPLAAAPLRRRKLRVR
jgi:hypothetical protein